jgi:hypothetical protein
MGIASDLAAAVDAAAFAHTAGIEPDPWQAQLLRSTAPRILVNCSQQSGKSTIAAVLALHGALYDAGSLALLVSPTLRQSGELFRKCLAVYRALGRPVPAEAETALTLELENGSRIVSLPGKEGTIRGYSGVRLLVLDEASRVPEDLYLAVRPMLAVSGGRLIAPSTPFGTRGFWFEAWRGPEPWERYEVTAEQCPRISASFLEEEHRTLGDWWYRQEYGCEFMDGQTAAFARDDVEAAFSEEVQPWEL